MGTIFIRTIILYITVMIAMRLMGKRQVGELQPSELVITIMISELAAIPAASIGVPLVSGIVPVLTLIIAEIVVSFFAMKSKGFRKVVSGSPSVIIRNGKINYVEMERIRMNIDDLLEETRIAGYPVISDIKLAIVETNGKLSIIQ